MFCTSKNFIICAISLKIFIVLILLFFILSNNLNPKNRQVIHKFPSEHLSIFIQENLLVGFTAGISIGIMAIFRKKKWSAVVIYFFAVFLLMILLNLLFYYSGCFHLFLKNDVDFNWYPFSELVFGILGVSLFVFVLITGILFWCSFPLQNEWQKLWQPRQISFRIFEIIIFALAYSLPSLWIAQKINQKINTKDFITVAISLFLFAFLFIGLELSGIWSSIGLVVKS